MPDQPTSWWRAFDAEDIALAVSLALVATGTAMLWGLAIMLLVLGVLGLTGVLFTSIWRGAAARRADR